MITTGARKSSPAAARRPTFAAGSTAAKSAPRHPTDRGLWAGIAFREPSHLRGFHRGHHFHPGERPIPAGRLRQLPPSSADFSAHTAIECLFLIRNVRRLSTQAIGVPHSGHARKLISEICKLLAAVSRLASSAVCSVWNCEIALVMSTSFSCDISVCVAVFCC